jgi:signal transduction histidine kinase
MPSPPAAPLGSADSQLLRVVERLRVVLPVAIFLFVLMHQAWETAVVNGWPAPARFTEGVLVYGLVGPLVTFWTLDWIARAVAARQEAEAAVQRLNRELETRVAERTAALAAVTAELRAANAELLAVNAELTQLDALKDEFVDLVSHELRAPLTNISASVELLLAAELPARAHAKLDIIGQETQRLTRLVQSVLDVSRIQAGRLQLHLVPCPAAALCATAVARQPQDRPWQVSVAPDTPPIMADAERIHHVLANVLDNAAKYSRPGTPVQLTARLLGAGTVLFAVADQGSGIPPTELEHIFERFHRVERGDAKATYGHGLGLYIARRLVEAHGGRMWAESLPGAGATVLWTLPVALEAAS